MGYFVFYRENGDRTWQGWWQKLILLGWTQNGSCQDGGQNCSYWDRSKIVHVQTSKTVHVEMVPKLFLLVWRQNFSCCDSGQNWSYWDGSKIVHVEMVAKLFLLVWRQHFSYLDGVKIVLIRMEPNIFMLCWLPNLFLLGWWWNSPCFNGSKNSSH